MNPDSRTLHDEYSPSRSPLQLLVDPLSMFRSGRRSSPLLQLLGNPFWMLHSADGENAAGAAPAHLLRQPMVRRAFWRLKTAAFAYSLGGMAVLIMALLVPFGEDNASRLGVVIRAACVVLVAVVILVLSFVAARGSRSAYHYLRVFACLESFGIVVVSMVIPGDPVTLHVAKLVVGVLAILTAVTSFSPQIRRALMKPKPGAQVAAAPH